MSKPERLFRLMHLLRTLPHPVTAARLADELDVSERTLYRDVDSLRFAGARIDGEAGLGYTLTEDSALPPQTLTQLEIEALVIGLGEVTNMGDDALATAAKDALGKIVASLPEPSQRQAMHAVSMVRRSHDNPSANCGDLTLIRKACWDEQAIDIKYEAKSGKHSTRRIYPLAIAYLDDRLLLLAWCKLREDFRMFFPKMISEAKVTDESFRPRRVSLLRAHVDQLRAQREAGKKDMEKLTAAGIAELKARGVTVPLSRFPDE